MVAAGQVLAGPKVAAPLSGQRRGGGNGIHPYREWTGARWRWSLCSNWPVPRTSRAPSPPPNTSLLARQPGRRIPRISGLARPHAWIKGNALAACCRLGPAADPRVPASPRL